MVKPRYKKMIVSYHQNMQSFNGLSKFKSHSNTNVKLASGWTEFQADKLYHFNSQNVLQDKPPCQWMMAAECQTVNERWRWLHNASIWCPTFS